MRISLEPPKKDRGLWWNKNELFRCETERSAEWEHVAASILLQLYLQASWYECYAAGRLFVSRDWTLYLDRGNNEWSSRASLSVPWMLKWGDVTVTLQKDMKTLPKPPLKHCETQREFTEFNTSEAPLYVFHGFVSCWVKEEVKQYHKMHIRNVISAQKNRNQCVTLIKDHKIHSIFAFFKPGQRKNDSPFIQEWRSWINDSWKLRTSLVFWMLKPADGAAVLPATFSTVKVKGKVTICAHSTECKGQSETHTASFKSVCGGQIGVETVCGVCGENAGFTGVTGFINADSASVAHLN